MGNKKSSLSHGEGQQKHQEVDDSVIVHTVEDVSSKSPKSEVSWYYSRNRNTWNLS